MGEVLPDWTRILATPARTSISPPSVNGGYVVDVSDRFFGEPRNMLMPYPAREHGRRLGDRSGAAGPGTTGRSCGSASRARSRRIEIDTAHFKGNYPDSASRRGDAGEGRAPAACRPTCDARDRRLDARPAADEAAGRSPARVRRASSRADVHASHVRLNIYPDGGVSRFRVFGVPTPDARRQAVLRQLNAMDAPELRAALRRLLRRACVDRPDGRVAPVCQRRRRCWRRPTRRRRAVR